MLRPTTAIIKYPKFSSYKESVVFAIIIVDIVDIIVTLTRHDKETIS
jgi:hypothetical protein